jgi:hypothetical protein
MTQYEFEYDDERKNMTKYQFEYDDEKNLTLEV